MPKMIDIREFNACANALADLGDKARPQTAVRAATVGDALATPEDRTFTFVFSDESVDRYGDVIYARGWDLANFNANPIALFGHDAGTVENVIGKAKNVRVEGTRLIGDIEFMAAEVNPRAEAVYQMVKGGFLKTVSVGFQPIEWELAKEKDRPQGVNFKKQELLEISVVPIPANPNALQQARAAGIAIERLGLTIEEPEPATPNFRALARSYRKKGLYELSNLCDLVAYADWLCACVEDEAADEGDGSPLPARMRAWVNEGNAIIAAMAKEETDENIAGGQDPAALADEVAERAVSRALEAFGVTRSGKAISAANEKQLRAAHDHMNDAVACIRAVIEPDGDENGSDSDADGDGKKDMDESADDAEARALRARRAAARRRAANFQPDH